MRRAERRRLRYFEVHLDRDKLRSFNRWLGFSDDNPMYGPLRTFRNLGMIRSEKRRKK